MKAYESALSCVRFTLSIVWMDCEGMKVVFPKDVLILKTRDVPYGDQPHQITFVISCGCYINNIQSSTFIDSIGEHPANIINRSITAHEIKEAVFGVFSYIFPDGNSSSISEIFPSPTKLNMADSLKTHHTFLPFMTGTYEKDFSFITFMVGTTLSLISRL